jgi:hypothetical protein
MENTRLIAVQADCWTTEARTGVEMEESVWVAQGRFSAFGVSWQIQTDQVSAYHLLLDRFPIGSNPASSKTVARAYSFRTLMGALVLDGEPDEPVYVLEADGRVIARSTDAAEVAEAFETDLAWLVSERSPRRVFLRAGVVGWRDRAIVIPGGPRTGKSTLVRALVSCGASYFSDQYAVLEGNTVSPYPSRTVGWSMPLAVRGNWDVEDMRPPKPLPVGVVLFAPYQSGAVFRPKMLSRGKFILGMFKYAVASQRDPERVLRSLEVVARRCNALEGVRGDAQTVATYLLDRLV